MPVHRSLPAALLLAAVAGMLSAGLNAQELEVPTIPGWKPWALDPATHRLSLDLGASAARGGTGCAKLVGSAAGSNARACIEQTFHGKTAIAPGKTLRYAVAYRTSAAFPGSGKLVIDSYGEPAATTKANLAALPLGSSEAWKTASGQITIPAGSTMIKLVLYLFGTGTIWFDDAFLGEVAEGSPNLLANGGLEAPASAVYDLAPERGSGVVKLSADFPNATLGTVKEIAPDEFYVYAFPQGKPRSNFLWFHFRLDGCAGREVTIRVNTTPFSKTNTGGNGTRLPVTSSDQETWTGIADKSWNADGSVLTFTHRFATSPAWVASFFPFTSEHLERFIARHQGNPRLSAGSIGTTPKGRALRVLTITDPGVPEAGKRDIVLTSLQHDLETTGGMAVEGIARFLLSDDPRALRLCRAFVFRLVPILDPDGIAQGNLYCPVGNMNRQWGLGTTPETASVERMVKDLAARGRRVELFMDFHGWCTPERATEFDSFGAEIGDAASEADATRLVDTIKARLSGKTSYRVNRKPTMRLWDGDIDINRVSEGWMKVSGGTRLSFGLEIFGEGECTQEGYLAWGQAFAEGFSAFYGLDR